ncbi:MAG: DNA polymerase [Oscillospiraceae bacterium]|nr:DNA polymerase [Oscillospiraceae bacterium]
MRHMSIDIETYSSVSIKDAGLYKYVQSGDFKVLLFAYSFDGSIPVIVDLAQGEHIPSEVRMALFSGDVIKHAYNAAFEWYCLSKYFGVNEPKYWLPQWRCTMVHGLYCGLIGGLGKIGEALGLPADKQKDRIGGSLIQKFCVPGKNGKPVTPAQEPEKWALFKKYCVQDVVTEMEVERRLSAFPVPDFVQAEWEQDMRVNAAGVRLDMDLAEGAVAFSDAETDGLKAQAKAVTGLSNPNSPAQLKAWIGDNLGEVPSSLSKAAVEELLDREDLPPKVRAALELRQKLGKTSVSKYKAMLECVCPDGRIRGLLQFYGASRTGRWAGRLVQMQNLPRNYIEELDYARDLVKAGRVDELAFVFGNVPDTLSQLIRTAFIPAEGHRFVVADFSAIEARVIAWLAGEQWRMQAFANGEDIYCASASRIYGVPVVKHGENGHLRQKGKIAELACGYGGSVGAMKAMGGANLTDEELKQIVDDWRKASPNIPRLWYRLENAAMDAIRTGVPVMANGLVFRYEGTAEGLRFLTIQLPSGRKLFYCNPFFGLNRFGKDSIHYWGANTGNWRELETYGGKLTENIVQAIARDCLAYALKNIEDAGYRIVMHIHDEVILDVPAADADLDRVCRIMCQTPPWAAGLLLNAAGFVGAYYFKS